MKKSKSFFRARRIGLCGSQKPSTKEFLAFCEEVGRSVAKFSDTIAVIAGRKNKADTEFLNGVKKEIRVQDISSRLETFWFKNETKPERYFQAGTIVEIDGASRESRRLSMVHAVDGLIGIGGTKGTDQQLTFAFATETPALPVPCFGGKSRDIWRDHRDLLIERLKISKKSATEWEQTPKNVTEARRLAKDMVKKFLASLVQRCFVIMPFAEDFSPLIDFVIDPVVRSLGDKPIHLGRREQPGDVGRQISEGLSKADYVICVLDGMRPNVLYELGMAHALGKPSVLLWKKTTDNEIRAPFDIAQEQRIKYPSIDNRLKPRLEKAIRHIKMQLLGK